MHSIEDNSSGNTTINATVALRLFITSLIKRYTNSFTAIIVVPLHEILDNIYQLLSHGPTCQSSMSFIRVPGALHPSSLVESDLMLSKSQ